MNTWKKLIPILFAIVLGTSLLALPALAYADVDYDSNVAQAINGGNHVIDEDGLLSSSDISKLEEKASEIGSSYDVAPYFVTIKSLGDYSAAESYIEDFADTYDLEDVASKGSVAFLLCVDDNQYALDAFGSAKKTFSDSELEYLSTDIFPYLGRSDWAGAAETFFGDVAQTLGGNKANVTSDVSYTAGSYVIDDYGLLSSETRNQLEATAKELAAQYNMGVYLLIVDNMGSMSPSSAERTNFATSFYRANNLGLGSGKDGIMLTLAIASRDYVTIGYGQGSYSFSDEGIEAMEEAVKDELRDDDWEGGCNAYYSQIGDQLAYYDAKGEPWTEPDLLSLLLKILATLGIPAGVAAARIRGEKAAMKTAHEQTEAANYLVKDSFALTRSNDRFINTTLIATPIPKHEDHDSGGGFGGGGWGGGGGGGFSSSGGGKF